MAESMRRRLERLEEQSLAPYALRSAGATRRLSLDPEGRGFDYRSHFQRDRDRIVYSRAFRRLRQKAQSGILPAYEDHRRNRLTHTLEVTQLARTIGRTLRLNEDLVETVALAHDLGQPPFGPTGERALDDLLVGRLDGRGGPGHGDLGGFDHSAQGLRVVDSIEKRYAHPGLNLTDPVREGILKTGDSVRWRGPEPRGVRPELAPSFEVQAVRLADRLATALHELDDALQSGAVEPAAVERLGGVRRIREKLGDAYPVRGGRFVKANAIHRGLVHLMVTGAVLQSGKNLERWAREHEVDGYEAFERVRDEAVRGDEVALPPRALELVVEIEGFLDTRVRRGHEADQVEARGRRVVLGLFAAYFADPTLLEDHVLLRCKSVIGGPYLRDVPRERLEDQVRRRFHRDPRFIEVVADHLAAMTDGYALAEHARLLAMGAVPIPGAEQLRRER